MATRHSSAQGFARTDRISEQIRRDLSELLRQVKDPRVADLLPLVTITDVEITPDYSHAKVFYTLMTSSDLDTTQHALERAAGFMRSEVARRIKLFTVPQLHFVYDHSIERGVHMTQLINQVAQDDAASRVDDNAADSAADDNAKL